MNRDDMALIRQRIFSWCISLVQILQSIGIQLFEPGQMRGHEGHEFDQTGGWVNIAVSRCETPGRVPEAGKEYVAHLARISGLVFVLQVKTVDEHSAFLVCKAPKIFPPIGITRIPEYFGGRPSYLEHVVAHDIPH